MPHPVRSISTSSYIVFPPFKSKIAFISKKMIIYPPPPFHLILFMDPFKRKPSRQLQMFCRLILDCMSFTTTTSRNFLIWADFIRTFQLIQDNLRNPQLALIRLAPELSKIFNKPLQFSGKCQTFFKFPTQFYICKLFTFKQSLHLSTQHYNTFESSKLVKQLLIWDCKIQGISYKGHFFYI